MAKVRRRGGGGRGLEMGLTATLRAALALHMRCPDFIRKSPCRLMTLPPAAKARPSQLAAIGSSTHLDSLAAGASDEETKAQGASGSEQQGADVTGSDWTEGIKWKKLITKALEVRRWALSWLAPACWSNEPISRLWIMRGSA